jgi:hypothetical protein
MEVGRWSWWAGEGVMDMGRGEDGRWGMGAVGRWESGEFSNMREGAG